jgi:hypothetical protein
MCAGEPCARERIDTHARAARPYRAFEGAPPAQGTARTTRTTDNDGGTLMLHVIGPLILAAPAAVAPQDPANYHQNQQNPQQDPRDARGSERRFSEPEAFDPRWQGQDEPRVRDLRTDDGRAWLGVALGDKDDRPGLEIESVTPGSPAARAGLRSGDRLIAIDGTKVTDRARVVELLDEKGPGTRAEVIVRRQIDARLDEQHRTDDGRLALGLYMRNARDQGGRSLEVGSVDPDQPAGRAGIRAGDRVVAIDGEPLDDYEDLQEAMREHDRAGRVRIAIERPYQIALGSAVEANAPTGAQRPYEGSMTGRQEVDAQRLQQELRTVSEELRTLRAELAALRTELRTYRDQQRDTLRFDRENGRDAFRDDDR